MTVTVHRIETKQGMPPLKLFISHSSRLDDVAHRYTDQDANWRLLGEVVDGLKARYGDAIRILVDRDGLIPGDDWNRELNLWLAECQAAVILVSRRALERSDWVAKEAAILGWRKSLDPSFTLIPVTIEGESKASDMAQGFFGALDMGRLQAVHSERNADAIVAAVARRFTHDQTLEQSRRETPLDLLRDAVAHTLTNSQSPNILDAALEALDAHHPLDDEPSQPGLPHPQQCGHRLARRLLRASVDDVWTCFETLRKLLCHAAPPLPVQTARWLFGLVRALWVNPGSAACLRAPRAGRPALVLCGAYVTAAGPCQGSSAYTFERYLERAWSHGDSGPLVVSLTRPDMRADEVWRMILAKVQPGRCDPRSPGAIKAAARSEVVLFMPASEDLGGLPDAERLDELFELAPNLGGLVLLFASCEPADGLPEGMLPVVPLLDPDLEEDAYSAEHLEAAHFEQRYACRP